MSIRTVTIQTSSQVLTQLKRTMLDMTHNTLCCTAVVERVSRLARWAISSLGKKTTSMQGGTLPSCGFGWRVVQTDGMQCRSSANRPYSVYWLCCLQLLFSKPGASATLHSGFEPRCAQRTHAHMWSAALVRAHERQHSDSSGQRAGEQREESRPRGPAAEACLLVAAACPAVGAYLEEEASLAAFHDPSSLACPVACRACRACPAFRAYPAFRACPVGACPVAVACLEVVVHHRHQVEAACQVACPAAGCRSVRAACRAAACQVLAGVSPPVRQQILRRRGH